MPHLRKLLITVGCVLAVATVLPRRAPEAPLQPAAAGSRAPHGAGRAVLASADRGPDGAAMLRHASPASTLPPDLAEDDDGIVKSPYNSGAALTRGPQSGFGRADATDVVRSDLEAARALQALQATPTPRPTATPAEEPFEFTDAELAELGQKSDGSRAEVNDQGIIPGISNRREPSDRGYVADAAVTPSPAPSPTPTPGMLTGQARGYQMLYMMHPAARLTVERQVQIMINSRARELYLGVLTDGTFGKDFAYVAQVLQRLRAAGRVTTLALYLTNGSAMRMHNNADAAFNDVDPFEFRSLIRWDEPTRQRFVELTRAAGPLFELNASLHPENQNIAIVMLEDNLQRDSYAAMRERAASVLGNGLVEFVRNPCPGCVEGNDSDSVGDAIETHSVGGAAALSPGDALVLDGSGYFFPWEPPRAQALSIDQVLGLQREAIALGLSYVGLWRAARQGLGNVTTDVHPNQRSYEAPTEAQAQIEVQLLEEGLYAEEPLASDEEVVPAP